MRVQVAAKQAKKLTIEQQEAFVSFLKNLRFFERNLVMFLLSMKAGLRAKEIAGLRWRSVTDASGNVSDFVIIENRVSKGGYSGREIPMNRDLQNALIVLHRMMNPSKNDFVINSHRTNTGMSPQSIVNTFYLWYRDIGFSGASSHSGRRTFITNAARQINLVGGSLRDVQQLAGHKNMHTTQRYIDGNEAAKRKIVDLI